MERGQWDTSGVPVDSRAKISRGIPEEEEDEEEEDGSACGKRGPAEAPALRDDS